VRELTPETITDAVLDQMTTTPDPRLKSIMASAVKYPHAFAREVNLTPGEGIKGIDKMAVADGTHTRLLGPFHREAPSPRKAGSSIARNPKQSKLAPAGAYG
jgi:hydroxyquinol 1,2-dioxygenase